jgi:hypothetical protein
VTDIVDRHAEDGSPLLKSSKWARLAKITKRCVAIGIWVFFLTKLFVFDVDIYIINTYFPELGWLVSYKFFLSVVIIGIFAALFKRWQVVSFIGYVIFYPLFLIGIALPYVIYKTRNWKIAFAIIHGVFHFLARFKRNAILSAMFFGSVLITAVSASPEMLITAIVIMLSYLGSVYTLRVISVFKEDPAYQIYKKVFGFVNSRLRDTYRLDADIRDLPVASLNESQLEKWRSKLEITVISNRIALFVAGRLKEYQDSGISTIADALALLVTILIVVVGFALMNAALFKIDPVQFDFRGPPSAFTFFYYSFNTFVFSSVPQLDPTKLWSQTLSLTEKSLALFTVAILVSMFFSRKSQRQNADLENAVRDLRAEGALMQEFVRSEFRLRTIEDAIAEIERLKGGMISLILWLSRQLG